MKFFLRKANWDPVEDPVPENQAKTLGVSNSQKNRSVELLCAVCTGSRNYGRGEVDEPG